MNSTATSLAVSPTIGPARELVSAHAGHAEIYITCPSHFTAVTGPEPVVGSSSAEK